MFDKLTKFIRKQVDPNKELVPVKSIADHEHFRLFCLLKKGRKSKHVFQGAPCFQPTRFRLDDVLLPGEDGKSTESLLPTEDVQDSSQFTLTKDTAYRVGSAFSLPVDPVSAEVEGDGSFSTKISIKPKKKGVSNNSLVALSAERQINMDHPFIQQFQKTNLELYIICETLEALEETVYKESTKADGIFKAKFHALLSIKGTRDNEQGIVIPKGCTLAFRAMPLYISNGEWGVHFFPEATLRTMECVIGGPPQGKLQTVVREAELHYAIFSELSSGLLVMFLNTITAVMRDRNLFEELRQKMENVLEKTDGYELKTESPDLKDLLSTLDNSPRIRCFRLAQGITYTLDALAELLEDQLLLLLESLKRKIVPQQLKLVENLLEHELEEGNEPFHVDASLLSFPGQEEQILTMALVELSGVKLQEDGSAVPVEQPFEAVAALYVALHFLNLLSGSE